MTPTNQASSDAQFDSGDWMNAIENLEASDPAAAAEWSASHEDETGPTIEEFAAERGIELDYSEAA
jgi:hypothetical protein